jgi:Tfp pilus assembly protein PilF
VPQPELSEQAARTEAWQVLARRTGIAAHKDRANALLGALTKRALESADATPDQLLVMASLCEEEGDKASAETAYGRVLSKEPGNIVAMNNLAMILSDRGETAAAEKLALRAVGDDHSRRANCYDTLATVQSKAQRWSDAEKSINEALKLDPENVGYRIHKAWILLEDGRDYTKAKDALDAVAARPEDPRLTSTDRERLQSLLKKFSTRS